MCWIGSYSKIEIESLARKVKALRRSAHIMHHVNSLSFYSHLKRIIIINTNAMEDYVDYLFGQAMFL